MRYPGRIPAGGRYSEQVRMIDLVPTVLELVGLPPAVDVMGQSLTPLFSEGALAGDTLAISELFSLGRALRSFRRPDRKAILHEPTGAAVIFNLQTDPGEMDPLPDTSSRLAQAMVNDVGVGTQLLRDFRARLGTSTTAPAMPEKVRQRLESLGYIRGDEGEPEDAP
jgi:arylsulfatase A-like enzyme